MSPRLLALIPFAVGINLAVGVSVSAVGLPLYLDTIGTVMVAALAGPVPAVLTGLFTQTAFTITTGQAMWLTFLPVQIVVALFASLAAYLGAFSGRYRAAAWGVGLGVVAATSSWPIAMYWGGVTAFGVTAVTTLLNLVGAPLELAVYLASLGVDTIDKTVVFSVVFVLLSSLPNRVVARFTHAEKALGRA